MSQCKNCEQLQKQIDDLKGIRRQQADRIVTLDYEAKRLRDQLKTLKKQARGEYEGNEL